ncbi:hypothetical protein ACSVC9_00730 [Clostridium sp. LBM24168]
MAYKNSIHKIAAVAVIMLIVIAAVSINVSAKMDGVVLKDSSGKLYNFNYEKLKTSLLNEGALYQKFRALKEESASVYSYHDDVQEKYILRTNLINAFLNSTEDKFNAQLATETLKTADMPSIVYDQVENSDGTISEIPINEDDFDVISIY